MVCHLQLRRLVFAAHTSAQVTFDFGPGLNVVYGEEPNAASLAIEAIDFVLGASRKPMLSAFGFNRILLTLETSDGKLVTLERSLAGSAIRIYHGAPDPGGETGHVKSVSPKYHPRVRDNISSFLLDMIGSDELAKSVERDNTLKNLSFRSLVQYFLISERDIFKEGSILETGQSRSPDLDLVVFNLLQAGAAGNRATQSPTTTGPDSTQQLLSLARLQTLEGVIEAAKRLSERSSASGTNPPGPNPLAGGSGALSTLQSIERHPLSLLIEELEERKSALKWLAEQIDENAGSMAASGRSSLERFCNEIASLLAAWQPPDTPKVEFDVRARDFNISETPRRNLPRLDRGVVHAAVKIALLQRAALNDSLHAGFLVMHSPFLDGNTHDSVAVDAHKSAMRSRFYQNLSELSCAQLIVVQPGQAIDGITSQVQQAGFGSQRE